MIRNKLLVVAAVAVGLLTAATASAVSFTASATGPVTAYFYGQTAALGSDIGLWVNGVFQGVYGLQNHTASPGDALVLGNANAGDSLVFELRVSANPGGPPPVTYSLFSDPGLNADGLEHVVASAFAGGDFGIPAGTLVGFEDIAGGGDMDFNDHRFVFTNTRIEPTPDAGSTLGLVGVGLVTLGLIRRKLG